MMPPWILVLSAVLFCTCSGELDDTRIFHNQFAVHIPNASLSYVEGLARKHGFRSLGQIGALEEFYLFQHDRIRKRSTERSDYHHENLINEPEVAWVEQQHERKRIKRDDFQSSASSPISAAITAGGLFALGRGTEFPDPFYRDQWYLHGGSQEGFDMNVIPAWAKGYSGKGVVVSILDDGIQTNHPDLAQNYDPLASSDINDNDSDPMPRDNGDNKHGTRCAGEVAAVAFNSYCGVGVAFNASIGGVRMLDGTVNDAVEARALSLNPDHIDIYSASWGPEDDGKTVDGPGPLAKRAFINGIMKGRSGKGSIFVWASGNGGRHEDSCNCDGYTNSIFTLSISSATQGGFKPWYLEECSSTLATTYSSGRPDVDRSISTVDMDGSLRPEFLCTSEHTGTSASAPIAAGICALALEANPTLTWRDMQHLVVFTSRPDPLHDNSWVVNGIGKKVSHKYGYGLMDASAMVTLAEQWTNVPPQHVCQTPADTSDRPIPNGFGQKLEVVVETDACTGSAHEIRFLEHVQCRISLRFAPRGNLRIRLTSPSGTQSVLLFERPRDVLDSSFDDWPFMSVHFWGERAAGRWKLEILNAGNKRVNKAGILRKWQLVFYGTLLNPVRLRPPTSAKPTLIPVATIGRDVHDSTAPAPSPAPPVIPAEVVVTPAVPTFDSVGVINNKKPVAIPQGSFSFPGVPGFRPTYFPNTGYPDFLQFAGSEPVTYATPLDSKSGSTNPQTRPNCPRFSLNGSCVDSCPPIGYYSTVDQQCINCDLSCATCTGSGLLQCLNCASGFNRMLDKNLCLESCPDTYRLDEKNRTCIPCPPQCSKCDSSSTCSACQSRLVLHQGRCLASCPSGSYETDDNQCSPCDPACSTCHGPGEDHCVTCSPDRSQSVNGTCVQQCPSGTWSSSGRIKQCLPCPPGCSDCTLKGDGFGLECGACHHGWMLDRSSRLCINPAINQCHKNAEYYVDGSCYPCHGSCAACVGPSAGQCTRCGPENVIHSGSCLSSCPEGTFIESGSDGKYCRPCPFACAKCDGLDHCTECLGSLQLQDGQCLVSCQNGYYNDRGLCVRCHGSCAACAGPLATDCTDCSPGFAWFQQRCLSQCPLAHFKSSVTAGMDFCGRCHLSCGTCSGPSALDCINCADGFIPSNGSCVLNQREDGPLVQFVKESDGRGIRAKEDLTNEAAGPRDSTYSSWMVGIGASFLAGLIVVVAVQVRSRMADKYSRVSLEKNQDHYHQRRRALATKYDSGESRGGAQVLLLSSSDEFAVSDDENDEEDDDSIPRV